MPSKLVRQLAAHLNIEVDDAEQRLNDLVAQINERAEREGHVALPGFGTFRAGDEALTFEPAEALASAVNHRFAGLEPVEVEVPPTESDREQPPPEEANTTTEAASAKDERPDAVDAEPGEASAAPDVPPPADTGTDRPETQEKPSGDAIEATDGPEAPLASEEPDAAREPPEAAEEALSAEATEEATEERAAKMAATAGAARPEAPDNDARAASSPSEWASLSSSASPDDQPSRKRTGRFDSTTSPVTWTVFTVALLLIGGALLYYFLTPSDSPPSPSNPPATTQQEPPPTERNQPADAPPLTGDENASSETTSETEAPNAPANNPPPRIDPEAGGWTLVVASETSRPQARATLRRYAESLEGENLPFGVLEAAVSGTTRYRVAVGQFASQSKAAAAQERLAGRLPGDAWPYNIASE